MNQPPTLQRIAVTVRGVVQGVGFRPFVFRLAEEEQLAGWIGNNTEGVFLEVEGEPARVAAFVQRLRTEAPPLSRIDAVASREISPLREAGFRILQSAVLGRVHTAIPADAATCSDCLRELLDPADRRYQYPFTNCTNCGPRFTITRRVPYDRPQTSMASFPMCAACQREYDDPRNRRFHAQPNACWDCGPHVFYCDAEDANPLDSCTHSRADQWESIEKTIQKILAGRIVAIKGIGGFHLAVDATNSQAVERLRQRKHRFGKPLAVMVRDAEAASFLCDLHPDEAALLHTPARPIVLCAKKNPCLLAESVAPHLPWLGLFLPYAPLQHLLFADGRLRALVMTSANLSEEPICIDNAEAMERLRGVADAYLLHDREILQRADDSVAALVDGAPQLLRRARGYVPLGIALPYDAPPILAVGGHMKNAFALARGPHAYPSQHLGDLENLSAMDFFSESLDHLMRTFEIEPQSVAHDLHPGYISTQWAATWAAERNLPLLGVQHHHAHIAACMAEHQLMEPAVGLALDGTGFGLDGTIWGGEVLVVDPRNGTMRRSAHLEPFPLPGGDAAVREPWRAAFSALIHAGFPLDEAAQLSGASFADGKLVERMIERQINAPQTSSLGRLFDAVAAVLLYRKTVDYEAQAAIELEAAALSEPAKHAYPCALRTAESDEGLLCIETKNIWIRLIDDLRRGVAVSQIAASFHDSIAEAFIASASRVCQQTRISQVVLSGGCLHNRRLARCLREGLEAQGYRVYAHRHVSPGDGGLSYGQVAVACAHALARKNF